MIIIALVYSLFKYKFYALTLKLIITLITPMFYLLEQFKTYSNINCINKNASNLIKRHLCNVPMPRGVKWGKI